MRQTRVHKLVHEYTPTGRRNVAQPRKNGPTKTYEDGIRLGGIYAVVGATASGLPRNFVRGVQQIQLRTEDRENGDLGAVAP